MNPPRQPSMCSLSAATRWCHSDNCYYGKDRKLSFLVTIYSLTSFIHELWGSSWSKSGSLTGACSDLFSWLSVARNGVLEHKMYLLPALQLPTRCVHAYFKNIVNTVNLFCPNVSRHIRSSFSHPWWPGVWRHHFCLSIARPNPFV